MPQFGTSITDNSGIIYKSYFIVKVSNFDIGLQQMCVILRRGAVSNQNEFEICRLKNNSFLT